MSDQRHSALILRYPRVRHDTLCTCFSLKQRNGVSAIQDGLRVKIVGNNGDRWAVRLPTVHSLTNSGFLSSRPGCDRFPLPVPSKEAQEKNKQSMATAIVLEPDVGDGDPTGALKYTVRVPGDIYSVTVPADYLASLPDDTPVKIEVGAIGWGDNATLPRKTISASM